MTVNNSEVNMAVVSDKTVPWPAKAYYLMNSYRFIVRMMHQVEHHDQFLNEEVRLFVNNPNMQLFRLSD
jgi:hypothetical protein